MLFREKLAAYLCDDSLEDTAFWKDYIPSTSALSRAGLSHFAWDCKIDVFAKANHDIFHAQLVAALRKADVFYFLKIRELHNIFSR